jgi:ParB family chromosome partitioning protein
MVKKKGLPDFVKSKYDNHFVDEITIRTKTAIIRNIPISKIIPNVLQPRKDFGDITELSKSIKEKGIMEPILVRPKNGQFEIIVGERRYRAAKLADLKEVPCIEYDVPDNEALELSIIENIQRKDLNIFEQAQSLKSLADIYGYTHQEIAKKIGKSRVTVTELIRITDLPGEIIQQCSQMNINSKTFLLELVKLDDIEKMKEILDEYEKKPFSRDKIKEKRKDLHDNSKDEKAQGIKFNFVTEDKAVKIKFDLKDNKTDKNKIIEILEKLIYDIKHNKIKEFDL